MTWEYIINGIIVILLTILWYFLRRTMGDLDKVKSDIDEVKLHYTSKSDLAKVRNEVEDVKINYTPRTDFKELKNKIDRVTEKVAEVQLNSISKNDFFIKMSEIATTLERMEDKMERYRDGK